MGKITMISAAMLGKLKGPDYPLVNLYPGPPPANQNDLFRLQYKRSYSNPMGYLNGKNMGLMLPCKCLIARHTSLIRVLGARSLPDRFDLHGRGAPDINLQGSNYSCMHKFRNLVSDNKNPVNLDFIYNIQLYSNILY